MGAATEPNTEGSVEAAGSSAFGKYQLFASLGRGGMADVFLSVARGQMGFNKLAVIKRLRQALAEEKAFRTMFLDEARLAARLSHPNIVHTYEVGEQNGVYFIAMEYLEGQSLNKVLKECHRKKELIEPQLSVRIVAEALAGLGYAHELRDYDGRPLSVIHRDVSPHNIFVTYDGHTKLVDFGIAKASLSSTETEVGVLKGKVAYMSPEQAMGHKIDARSDLFAMGIVLWELLAQRRLMTGESAANTLHKLMNEPIPRLSSVLPQVDPALDALVTRALDKDPARRFQSAAEMRAALEGWLTTHGFTVREEEVGIRMMSLFGSVREDVQRQIQKHMAATTTAENTRQLQALTAESLHRMAQSGANVTGQLLRLGTAGSGSGSGVVPNYGGLDRQSAYPSLVPGQAEVTGPPPMVAPPPQKSNNALLIVITTGCFVLAGLLIIVFGLRDRRRQAEMDANAAANASALAPPTLVTAAPSETAADPPATSAPTVVASSLPPASSPSASSTSTSSNSGSNTGKGHHSTPAPPRPTTTPGTKPDRPPPAPAEDPGFLTVSAYPWAKVTEGGRVVCPVTPCNKVQMSAGNHTLTFENGDGSGQKQTVSVVVRSGETATKNVGFK